MGLLGAVLVDKTTVHIGAVHIYVYTHTQDTHTHTHTHTHTQVRTHIHKYVSENWFGIETFG